tara:strand:+ start:149 stop:490 length:342 start_codon:yes stop_codon:yes gene_type:complete
MWEKGRQGTGYLKKKIFQFANYWFAMDCYILKYPEKSYIPPHTDPIEGHKHFRLNIVLKKAAVGGNVYYFKTRCYNRIMLFRPDAVEHEVSQVTRGTRIVLSVGLAIRKKKKV